MHQVTDAEVVDPAARRRRAMGEAIARLRTGWHYSLEELAADVGVDVDTFRSWEAGDVDMTFEQVLAIEDAVGAPRGRMAAAGSYTSFEVTGATREELVVTKHLDSLREVVKALKAVQELGIGVAVRNGLALEEEGEDWDLHRETWTVELYGGAPVHGEDLD